MTGNIKHIIVIESLTNRDGANFTGEALYNDVIRRQIDLYERDFTHIFYKATSKQEFIEIITSYIPKSKELEGGILIHLEMHGDENLGGLILSSGELVGWEELADLFREININTCNKLFITLGTCFGRFLYKGVNPYKKSPYSGYISASIEVNPEEVYIKFGKLFEELINRGNIVEGYLEMEKTESNFYYKDSERVFEEAFNSSMQQLKNGLRNEMLSESIEQVKNEIGADIPPNIAEVLFDLALRNIYLAQKKAFDFEDCK
ncbi:hypothetical protein HUE46_10795 [Flavobacterium columnare]|uniref:hypothetical protein n=1 Tax=Flavobacterium TaxID=237 RepID=UPI000B4D8632|nr:MULTISPECIES: hypothetical protein [Flavobacterium]MBF6652039.1 hypothetical protein [Flavobacterium columnare]MBF6654357.1 hypothetical protein [Flavobacterium columnare]OWP86210.1 hypothetical protein BWK60_09985 [Flavobacterium covae]QOG90444.1 hypothetical protein HUE41_10795 [Flavobacterium columnare]QOG93100.1 hypothetical protein HUE42_10790 [Flavobacterium columnare]